jgi:hypothetical protein
MFFPHPFPLLGGDRGGGKESSCRLGDGGENFCPRVIFDLVGVRGRVRRESGCAASGWGSITFVRIQCLSKVKTPCFDALTHLKYM